MMRHTFVSGKKTPAEADPPPATRAFEALLCDPDGAEAARNILDDLDDTYLHNIAEAAIALAGLAHNLYMHRADQRWNRL